MATNAGSGHQRGSVNDRSQMKTPGGNYVKRNAGTGRFMDQKASGRPLKGVAKEKGGLQ
jgi:transcriptional regulator of nitric oxide reductase